MTPARFFVTVSRVSVEISRIAPALNASVGEDTVVPRAEVASHELVVTFLVFCILRSEQHEIQAPDPNFGFAKAQGKCAHAQLHLGPKRRVAHAF